MEYPVFDGPSFVGYMDEEDCRDILRTRQGRLLRKGNSARVILNRDAIPRARALCNTASRSVMATTQREELYSGFRKEFTDTPMTVNPITVLRRPGDVIGRDMLGREVFSFVDWTERDRFPRHGFNPDLLPRPNFTRPASHCNFVSAA